MLKLFKDIADISVGEFLATKAAEYVETEDHKYLKEIYDCFSRIAKTEYYNLGHYARSSYSPIEAYYFFEPDKEKLAKGVIYTLAKKVKEGEEYDY